MGTHVGGTRQGVSGRGEDCHHRPSLELHKAKKKEDGSTIPQAAVRDMRVLPGLYARSPCLISMSDLRARFPCLVST